MSERTATIYERAVDGYPSDLLLSSIERAGILLAPPGGHDISVLSEIGDQVPCDREALRDRLTTSHSTSFQAWFPSMSELYCRVRRHHTAWATDFGMEGMEQDERQVVETLVRSLFRSKVASGKAMGVVFDPEGVSEDVMWDDVIMHGGNIDSLPTCEMPAIVLIRAPISRPGDTSTATESLHFQSFGTALIELEDWAAPVPPAGQSES